MLRRLSWGQGVAYYEIGIHDEGYNEGIDRKQVYETMIVLFFMSNDLGEQYGQTSIEVDEVRLGYATLSD